MTHAVFSPTQLEWIRQHLKVAVIHGGDKSHTSGFIFENLSPRSSKTYAAVAHDIACALMESGFQHVEVLAEDIELAQQLREKQIDLVITNSGGLQGFDAMCHLPSTLEMLGVPYVGHSPMTAGVLDNKHLFKHEITAAGLPTAPFVTVGIDEAFEAPDKQAAIDAIAGRFNDGFIVKPVSGRASIHVYPVFDRRELAAVVEKVRLATSHTVMIEPFLAGREFVVAVAGEYVFKEGRLTQSSTPLAFSITERLLAADEPIFTSMDVKPITQDRLVAVDEEPLRSQLAVIGQKIFRQLGLQTLVRVDLRMDTRGQLYVLETNPKPDLKRPQGNQISLVCHDLAREGMSYTDLVQSLVFNRLSFLKAQRPLAVAHCLTAQFDALYEVQEGS
ncbi:MULTISPECIES: D-alanine--D-alanine ligase family protein [unclassified Vibrio]|uniref:D-alanine--D-alanine ligase family protein n=1 Tax=unclassified Vibrio TaxID=2614977 RepID=UPI00136123A3|nr:MULTISPECIES: ATP-grasp domain-containing protein [unclassified Vibrio]NAW57732.1 ATP-grasp domain-containing protein [Vibrio sp. V36_P2S2PM302]NAX22994.1 ATP-grasp domain-containing protein [Vibrio sp. V39_P1S14PM300]NAX28034.1 ATP-grasp domain-containing protein [Vibrio sp. V38_P2S17PM301]NAX30217.1 ATP-grasp domain-containing protein [Vibrio sp. V37_P2S8PM304]